MLSNSALEPVNQEDGHESLSRLLIQCEADGISRECPESNAIDIVGEIHKGAYFRVSEHNGAIKRWANKNRHLIDDKLHDEMLDFIVLFENCCIAWNPHDYHSIFFNLASNILDRLPEGYPDVPKMALVRRLRNIIIGWRKTGL